MKKHLIISAFTLALSTAPALSQETAAIRKTPITVNTKGIEETADTLGKRVEDILYRYHENKQKQETEVQKLTDKIDTLNAAIMLTKTSAQNISGTISYACESEDLIDPNTGKCLDNIIRNEDDISIDIMDHVLLDQTVGAKTVYGAFKTWWRKIEDTPYHYNSVYQYPKENCKGYHRLPFKGTFKKSDISSKKYTIISTFSFSHPQNTNGGCKEASNTGYYNLKAKLSKDKKRIRMIIEAGSRGDFNEKEVGVWTDKLTIKSNRTQIRKINTSK